MGVDHIFYLAGGYVFGMPANHVFYAPYNIIVSVFVLAKAISGLGECLVGGEVTPEEIVVARVIGSSKEFGRLGKGEILVAHATAPAWTTLFTLTGGLVADLGGALSHGSLVAREYGIPAVMGTGVATRRIHSGQVITVDGGAGTVTLT